MDGQQVETREAPKHLRSLECRRLGASEEAGLCALSLPWPNAPAQALALGGQPTYVKPLGQWPNTATSSPRRLLMIADSAGSAPATLRLSDAVDAPSAPPTAEAELTARSVEEGFMWERHLLRLRWAGQSLGLALGLRTAGAVHWWEACRLVVLEQTPHCTVVQMGGAIPRELATRDGLMQHKGFHYPLLHHHNWLYGDIFARLHCNGVCEVFAHFINNKAVDTGGDLQDVVPLLGFAVQDDQALRSAPVGAWDGSSGRIDFGAVALDLTETARLATPEQPGRLDVAENMLVLEPFSGVDLYGGFCPHDLTGDPWLFHAKDRLFPRGLARTLRFTLSLNPQRSPVVARYLAPYWWYGQQRELWSDGPWLPVSGVFDQQLELAQAWVRRSVVRGGFEDGSVARHKPHMQGLTRDEPGWEGFMPHAQFLLAYRSGEVGDYSDALRSAYFVTDVVVDHASDLMRMHAFPPPAFALPMNRVTGSIAAYLETGDPYLLETAERVTDAAYRLHRNSWPRLAVGRDACFIRGAVMLYRYFNDEHYRRLAHEAALHVVETQRANGSFGDQGGGTGVHAWGGYITKPWMGLLATMPLLDYLELFPDEAALGQCVQRFADWLISSRWTREGYTGWSYQHDYNGALRHFHFYGGQWVVLPSAAPWHEDSIGRVMAWSTAASGDPRYLDAFLHSFEGVPFHGFDHHVYATLVYLPQLASWLWRPRLSERNIRIDPRQIGARTPTQATIHGPDGESPVRWTADQAIDAPPEVQAPPEAPPGVQAPPAIGAPGSAAQPA